MEIIDQKILHDSVRWPLSPLYEVRALPGEITKEESVAGDIVIANEDGDKRIIKQSEYTDNSALYTENGYQPIAVVVVPASHTPDGTARCMALEFVRGNSSNNINNLQITTGTDDPYPFISGPNTSSNSSSQYSDGKIYPLDELQTVQCNTIKYKVHGTTTISTTTQIGSPAQGGSGIPYNGDDPIATYVHATPAISPYGADGVSKNPDLFVEGGIVDYMNGYENTQKLVSHVVNTYTAYDSDNANNRSYTDLMQPAPWNTHLYHTIGTKAGSGATMGDWYLPAAGEIFYLPSRSEDIADGIKIARGFDTYSGVAGAITCYNYTYSGGLASCSFIIDTASYLLYHMYATSGHYLTTSSIGYAVVVVPFIKI